MQVERDWNTIQWSELTLREDQDWYCSLGDMVKHLPDVMERLTWPGYNNETRNNELTRICHAWITPEQIVKYGKLCDRGYTIDIIYDPSLTWPYREYSRDKKGVKVLKFRSEGDDFTVSI